MYQLQYKSKYYKQLVFPIKENCLIFKHGHISITNYRLGDNWEFEKQLSRWEQITPRYGRYELVGAYYIEEYRELRISRGYPVDRLKVFFPNHKILMDNNAIKTKKIDIQLTKSPKSDIQNVAITHMLSKYPYEKNSKYTQQILNADTGDGKTYCTIATICYFQKRSIIIAPSEKIINQWVESIYNFTNLDKKRVLVVQGSNMCEKIRKGKLDADIYIFSIDTLSSYIKYYGNIAMQELMDKTQAYTKIIDEAHENLRSIVSIEALSNFHMNYYLTASFTRSDKKEKFILLSLFNNVPRFGANFKKEEEKHINIFIKSYKFSPEPFEIKKMYRRGKGLNTMEYETVLLSAQGRNNDFFNSFISTIKWSLNKIKKDNKILVLCKTIAGAEYVAYVLRNQLNVSDIGAYHSKVDKETKKKILEGKIIVSVDKSLGTGADIKNIEHIHNIGTYSNEISAKQLPGRGRAIEGVKIIYIEYVNTIYSKTVDQFERRLPSLKKTSKTGKVVYIDT